MGAVCVAEVLVDDTPAAEVDDSLKFVSRVFLASAQYDKDGGGCRRSDGIGVGAGGTCDVW